LAGKEGGKKALPRWIKYHTTRGFFQGAGSGWQRKCHTVEQNVQRRARIQLERLRRGLAGPERYEGMLP
jgi:hypothetical protein